MSEVALALATRKPSVPTSDIGLSLNAKGDVQIAVQITDPDPVKAQQLAEDVFDALLAKYPRATTDAGGAA
jgi:hypothetical protein